MRSGCMGCPSIEIAVQLKSPLVNALHVYCCEVIAIVDLLRFQLELGANSWPVVGGRSSRFDPNPDKPVPDN